MTEEKLETISIARQGPRLDVRLARAKTRNAFDETMSAELTSVFRRAAADAGLRCLVLAGEGPVFCAGADLHWMRRAAEFARGSGGRPAWQG